MLLPCVPAVLLAHFQLLEASLTVDSYASRFLINGAVIPVDVCSLIVVLFVYTVRSVTLDPSVCAAAVVLSAPRVTVRLLPTTPVT